MYIAIRRYKIDPDMIDDAMELVKSKFLPDLVAIPGFKAFYDAHAGDDTIVSVSVFADKAGADASNRLAVECVREHAAGVITEPPEVIEGDVVVSEVAESFITTG